MRHLLLGATVLATIVAAAMWPPIPQSPAYHLFADTRSLLGIPNCLNVLFACAAGVGADRQTWDFGRVTSGHTLKHLVAAAGVACVVVMLRSRSQRRPGM